MSRGLRSPLDVVQEYKLLLSSKSDFSLLSLDLYLPETNPETSLSTGKKVPFTSLRQCGFRKYCFNNVEKFDLRSLAHAKTSYICANNHKHNPQTWRWKGNTAKYLSTGFWDFPLRQWKDSENFPSGSPEVFFFSLKLLAECYKKKHFIGTKYGRDISHEKVHCKTNIPQFESDKELYESPHKCASAFQLS